MEERGRKNTGGLENHTQEFCLYPVDDDEVLKEGNELNFRKLTATKKEISKEM